MTRLKIPPVVTILLVVLTGASIAAQFQADTREISWTANVRGAEQAQQPRTYRVYEEADEIRLRLNIYNGFEAPLLIDQQILHPGLGLKLSSAAGPMDIRVEWLPSIRLGREYRTQAVGGFETIRIEGNDGTGWTIGIRLASGEAFPPGTYRLEIVMKTAFAAFRNEQGEPWIGHWMLPDTDLTFIVRPPSTTRERVSQALTAGYLATQEGDMNAAAVAFNRAVQLDPSDDGAKASLAGVYILLKRHRDAIQLLEDVVARRPDSTADALVNAYMVVGDEANAARVLQSQGYSGQKLTAKLAELREIVRRR